MTANERAAIVKQPTLNKSILEISKGSDAKSLDGLEILSKGKVGRIK